MDKQTLYGFVYAKLHQFLNKTCGRWVKRWN